MPWEMSLKNPALDLRLCFGEGGAGLGEALRGRVMCMKTLCPTGETFPVEPQEGRRRQQRMMMGTLCLVMVVFH